MPAVAAATEAKRMLASACGPRFCHLAQVANMQVANWSAPPAAISPFGSSAHHLGSRPVPLGTRGYHTQTGFVRPAWLLAARAAAAESGGATSASKAPARLAQKQQLLEERTEEHSGIDEGPVPRITEDHVTVAFARSGGPGGQNVNKVNTKVDMRFNVIDATWLPERVRLKLLEQEKNRINSDGELVVSSTRTRTQKGNIDDALEKLQGILDKAAYVPPPPSEEKKKRINKLAKAENERRLGDKKKASSKKSDRRNKGSWD